MRWSNSFWTGLAIILLTASVSQAQLTTIAYEDFNYSSGSLAGRNGGTGWTNAWTHLYGSGGSLAVNTTGLTYSGLSTSGGTAEWASGGNGISESTRGLPLVNGGLVYFQFLGKFGSSSGGGTPNIRLTQSGTLTGGFGGNGGTYGAKMSILDTSLNAATDGSSSTAANLSSLNLVVTLIDYSNHETYMWVNPNLSTFDYLHPPTADAHYDGLAPAFDSIGIYTRSPGTIDEIKILAIPVPEPGTFVIFVLGAGMVCRALRKRERRLD